MPVFNAGYIDTSRSVISNGVLSETRKQEEIGRKIKIDYGISNDEIHNDFRNLLGDILVDILDDQLKEEKLEYVPDH